MIRCLKVSDIVMLEIILNLIKPSIIAHTGSETANHSGCLPVNAHAEVHILNLNYIYSFIFYSSATRFSNDILYSTIDYSDTFCYICFKA